MFIRCTEFNFSSYPCRTALTFDRKTEAVEAADRRTCPSLVHFYYDPDDGGVAPKVYLTLYRKAPPSSTQVLDPGSIKSYEPGYNRNL